MSIPDTQRAWVALKKGTPEQALQLKTDWPVTKKLKSGEVIVKVQAAALNPVGYKFLKLIPNWIANRPSAVEYDFAGVIADENDTTYKKGDAVFGWIRVESQWRTKQGSLAEYLVVASINTTIRPPNISIVDASGVALTAMTAFGGLNDANLEAGQTILINGASTAVGSFAIQLAKLRGAKVIAVASGKNEQYVRGLGADEFIDYTQVGPLHTYLSQSPPSVKYNVILECVAIYDPSLYTFSNAYLAPNGVYVTVGPQPDLSDWKSTFWDSLRIAAIYLPSFITGFRAPFRLTTVQSSKDNMLLLTKYLEEGAVKPVVDSVYNFEDALKAYDRIMTSRATGKVVVKVDNTIPDA